MLVCEDFDPICAGAPVTTGNAYERTYTDEKLEEGWYHTGTAVRYSNQQQLLFVAAFCLIISLGLRQVRHSCFHLSGEVNKSRLEYLTRFLVSIIKSNISALLLRIFKMMNSSHFLQFIAILVSLLSHGNAFLKTKGNVLIKNKLIVSRSSSTSQIETAAATSPSKPTATTVMKERFGKIWHKIDKTKHWKAAQKVWVSNETISTTAFVGNLERHVSEKMLGARLLEILGANVVKSFSILRGIDGTICII